MEIEEFKRAIKEIDFAIGDSFWINGINFEVKQKDYTKVKNLIIIKNEQRISF